MITIQQNKKIIITTIFILLCLGIYVFFPVTGNFQKIITALVFFVAIPLLFDALVLRKKITTYRLRVGDWKKGLFWLVVGLVVSGIIASALLKYSGWIANYKLPGGITGNFGYFLFYELVLVAFFSALYEFFFRGFVMFHFVPIFKHWAVAIQYVFFLLLLLVTVGYSWEFAPYIIFAPFAGWIAYKSDSLLYSFVGQLIFIIIIDASVIKMFA